MKNSKYILLVILVFNLFCAVGSTVKEDEEVIFFPTAAHLEEESGQWVLPIHGWIFEPEKDSKLRNALLEGLAKVSEKFFKRGVAPPTYYRTGSGKSHREEKVGQKNKVSEGINKRGVNFDKKRFQERLRMFIVDNERNKRITISVHGQTFTMKPSKPNGHFYGEVKIPADELKDSITYQALRVKGDGKFEGVGYLLEPEGVSVVSDIDDTIKYSQVLDKKKMLEKTFLEEFEAIPGMSEVYNAWQEQGGDPFTMYLHRPGSCIRRYPNLLKQKNSRPAAFT